MKNTLCKVISSLIPSSSKLYFLLLFLMGLSTSSMHADNIGFLVVATGKYIDFVPPLIKSAEKYFCRGHNVTFFVFTDRDFEHSANTIATYQDRMGWPYDTMMRGHVYYKHRELFKDQDYLFACDADMLFVDSVDDEILGDLVATIHPGFIDKRGSYETNRKSKAYVGRKEGKHYFAGGFYGGSKDRFLDIVKTNSEKIDNDLSRGIVAVWHDESHWNRYCIDHTPTVILNPSYCYPESWNLKYPKKLLALDKNHSEFRK